MAKEHDFSKVNLITVGEEEAGGRLDNYLVRLLKGVPRSFIYRILRRGEVRVNRHRADPALKLNPGDEIRVPPVRDVHENAPVVVPSSNLALVRDLEDRICFENDELMVVNKPCGLAAHGGSGIEFGLIEALRALRPEARYLELAHRLDRETSGCILIAKRRSALRHLHAQFRERIVKKRYLTLVRGKWDRRLKLVEAPLIRNELKSGERMVMVDFQRGAPAATIYEPLEFFPGATLLAALPATGRTHQIRVHCTYSGHPLAGDEKYGDKEFNALMRESGLKRMFLHAARITFTDPQSGEMLKVEAPLPKELEAVLDALRGHDE